MRPLLLLLAAVACLNSRAAADLDFFEKRIRPVLADRCYECHSARAKKLQSGLRLDTRDGMLQGGESGRPAVVPGDAERSQLVRALRWTDEHLQMPPKKKLSDTQMADFITWINAGAPDPRTANSQASYSTIQSSKPHWAFQPMKEPVLPKVKDSRWPQTPVDRFILAKLEAARLKPSPRADPRTLIRRLHFDLLGLPAAPEEVDSFVRKCSTGGWQPAIGNLVDRLLASPHYGERWGRYWLDAARYSDTKGYVYAREERFWVHAHTYRDWVIRAVNDDLPYDRFLVLQLAADQAAPDDLAAQAAMGFLTIGRRFLGVTHDVIDDRIDATTRAMLGLSVACARCHDHKYDPIPTADYYSLHGVFQSSVEKFVCLDPTPRDTDAFAAYEKELLARRKKLDDTMAAKRAETTARARARAGEYLAAQLDLSRFPEEGFDQILTDKDLIPGTVRRWRDFLDSRSRAFDPVFEPWHALRKLPPAGFEARARSALDQVSRGAGQLNPLVAAAFATVPTNMTEVPARYGKLFADVEKSWADTIKPATNSAQSAIRPASAGQSAISLPDPAAEQLRLVLHGADSPCTVPNTDIVNNEQLFPTGDVEAIWKLQGEVDRWLIRTPAAPPHAVVLHDSPLAASPRVFTRGNPAMRGAEVPRQFLEVIAGRERKPFTSGSGRLELARAIASPANPLTARVAVNRVWAHHFGAGLVRTPSDFGTRAEAPSHPELLDWLALRFVADGWSLKKLHKLIVMSAAYQQSSSGEPGSTQAQSFAFRVGAGGTAPSPDPDNRLLSRFPRQRLDWEALRDSLLFVSGELDTKVGGRPVELFKPPFSTRRAVYGLVDRQFVPGTLRVFDFANPDMHSPARPLTTVPQQSLYLLNSAFASDRARALAARSDASGVAPDERARRLFRFVHQREPTAPQLAAALEFVNSCTTDAPPPPAKPIVTAWQYGYGEFDEAAKRITNFTALPYFSGDAWQGGATYPDDKLGWLKLTADGGHPGNTLKHAVVRRWVAPREATVSVGGTVKHEAAPGDGIRAHIISSRGGLLATWTLHNSQTNAALAWVTLEKGDTLDFVVDIRANLNSDDFKWSPTIKATEPVAGLPSEWSAKAEFAGPTPPALKPLSPWEKLAQVLLLSNEFVFVD
jgi:mono/diheme cytochrome c family protein